MRKVSKMIGAGILLAGLIVFLYPNIMSFRLKVESRQIIEKFEETVESLEKGSAKKDQEGKAAEDDLGEEGSGEDGSIEEENRNAARNGDAAWDGDTLVRLLVQAEAYNEKIYQEKQAGLMDVWSYEQPPIHLGMEDDLFGYIEIPAMDLELPLYSGASAEHMAKGAVVMGQTSLPIGGENTNCVIAGHRGYWGAPFFREIEALQTGDMVYVTNPWETLAYQVTVITVIDPNDLEPVLIQDGKDMVTLITCHPYPSNQYRYVVYCERAENVEERLGNQETVQMPDGSGFKSSQPEIQKEKNLRIAGAIVILFLLAYMFWPKKKAKNS